MEVMSAEQVREVARIKEEGRIRRVVQINYMITGVLIVMIGVMVWQMILVKNMQVVDASTVVLLNLEGEGVEAQKHNLTLKKDSSQQTVVFTELETINGAPVLVSVSTNTIEEGATNVIVND
ncbi:MAG: hypothetical protein J6N72_00640 [Psychrobacter sp.]|nr:hypothetical protein [Psychrobacter sp.]